MKKRFFAALLSLVMVFSLLPVNALAASNSTVVLHPSVNHTVTGVKVKVGDKIDGHSITSISGYDITVDLGKYNVNNGTFRLPYAKDIWTGVDNNKVDYISWAGSGSNSRSEGANALLANGKNTAYYYFKGAPVLLTFTLNYDANGGTGAPASQTYKATSEYERSHSFTISSQEPTRENYTFLGWSTNKNATSASYQPSGSIVVTGTTKLYAVWEENTPPKPDKPTAPGEEDLSKLIGDITVNCTNDKAAHELKTKSYALISGSYTTSEVEGDAENGYTCTVTINAQEYVKKFKADTSKAHDPKDGTATVTLKYTDNGWTVTAGTPVVFNVACVPEITPPEKPTPPTVEIGGATVAVKCITGHGDLSWKIGSNTFTVGEVTGDDTTGYTCTVTVQAEVYVNAFNSNKKANGVKHTLADDAEKTFTMTYVNGAWTGPTNPAVTFEVKCEEELVPVHLVIYRNGNTSKAYQDIALEGQPKGHVIDLSTIDIADYYTGNYEFYGWYDDGLFNIYKSDPANPPVGLKEKTVNGWTNFKCMVYDYVPVVYFQSKEAWSDFQNDHSKTEGRLYSTTALFGSTLPTADAPTPTRTGYTFKFWSREGQTGDVTGQTVGGWTNLYAVWEKNTYTVTYTDGVDGKEVFADQTYNVQFEDAITAFDGTPTREGYTFTSWAWYKVENGNDVKIAEPHTMPAYGLKAVAQWTADPIAVDISQYVYKQYVQKYNRADTTTFNFTAEVYPAAMISSASSPVAVFANPLIDTVKGDVKIDSSKNGEVKQVTFEKTDKLSAGQYYVYITENTENKGTNSYITYDNSGYVLNIRVFDNGKTGLDVELLGINKVGENGQMKTTDDTTVTFVNTYTRASRPSTSSTSKPTLNTGDHYAYVMGYPDGTVRPNGSITRAEVSTILFRLLSDKTREEYFTTESSFTDVKAGAWYNNSVATLEKAGVIVDTAKGGVFRPDEAITRAELAAMLAQFSDAKPVKGVKFSDVSADHWAYDAIAIAAKMGWIEGYPDGTFRPDATITRAEMMTLVNRALERVPSDEDHLLSKRVMLTFPDCKSGDWFYIAVQEATNSHTYERAATEKNGDEQWTALRANRDWTLLEK